MPNIFDGFLTQLTTGDNIKDYKHASRLFVDNNYERSPKYTWLFHVFFDLNPELTAIPQLQQIEAGMLVKSVDLPKFRVDNKTYNNYNRPSIVQTKTKFEEINISFHDDSANIVRKLWFDYYNFYYRDMDNNYGDSTGALNDIYKKSNKQVLGQRNLYNKFGYSPRSGASAPGSNQYIQAIRIYSLHQKRFSEYTLINPVITSYQHGTHSNGQDGTLENSMSISYETVLYASGAAKVARGFADLHYDKSPSPLTVAGGGTNSILGPGGIVSAVSEVISDGSGGNWGSSAFKLVRGYQKNKNVDLVNLAQGELVQAFTNILRSGESTGQLNFGAALNATYIPYRGVNANQTSGFQSALATETTSAPGSVNSNGLNLTSAAAAITGGIGGALAAAGNPLSAVTSQISGVVTNAQGLITGGDLNKVVDLAKTGGNKLVASASQLISPNSFTAGIQLANDKIKSAADALASQNLQAEVGKATSFFTGPNAQNAVTAFQTGTNNIVSQAGALVTTPFKNLQFEAGSQLGNLLGSNNLSAPSATRYQGNMSTNPGSTST
jgi:hypothetical protein